jgi:plastocyanin
MRTAGYTLSAALVLMVSSCNGDDRPMSPTPNPGGSTGGATIVITSNGVSPKNVTVVLGAQVTFVNNDNRPHEMASDPHPSHGDCPQINQLGLIQPGTTTVRREI